VRPRPLQSINDRFGHEFGDKVLSTVADTLRLFAQETGALVARHGGEEFAALMVGVTEEQAFRYAEDLRHACDREVRNQGVSASVTISIGLAASLGEVELAKVMRAADQALYKAKHGGRNRVACTYASADQIAA
jgi:diguanylate cyclase (GGDEF)-like protein